MKKEDKDFLIKLQHEMLTQDTVGQADPRFWVVVQEVKEYGIEDDETGVEIYDRGCCEVVCEGELKDIYEWLHEEDFDLLFCDYEEMHNEIYIELQDETEYCITGVDELINFLSDLGYSNYEVVKYRVRQQIVENTFFLTRRECEEHIRLNGYHYTKPHPYAMTAWRSPQVERLYKILKETNWNEFK